MRSVSIRQVDMGKKETLINLGFEGENEFSKVRIDCKKTFDKYPSAVATLAVTDPAGNQYPAVLTRDGTWVEWTVTASDLTTRGDGEIQIIFTIDETVIGMTDPAKTRIKRSIKPTGTTPTPIANFIQQAGAILEEVDAAIPAGGTTGQVLAKKTDADRDLEWVDQTGGGGGTSDYDQLTHRPQIAGVTLTGNKSLSDFGIAAESDIPDVSGFYTKPSGGIPDTDLASGVQTSLGKADSAYQKPSGGIPSSDMASAVQTSLGKADTAYQKPSGGIPAADIASGVIPDPTSIIDDTAGSGDTGKAWSADKSASTAQNLLSEINGKYEKPNTGIPSSDMTDAVQTSLGKADSSYQKPSGGIPGTDLADSYIKEPSSDGTNGQVLTTDGNGGRSWTTPSGGGGNVTDVQVNGVSVLSQGVANIPKASSSVLGAAKFGSGLYVTNQGNVTIDKATNTSIKAGTNAYYPITPSNIDVAVFYGLTRLAGYDMKNDSSAVGTYPATAIDKILQLLGVFDLIAQHETTPSTHAYAQGECFIFNGKLCRATTAISIADSIAIGTNCEQTTLMAEITR